MTYQVSLSKAWADVESLSKERKHFVYFLSEEYIVDLEKKEILLTSSNSLPSEQISILILHYLFSKLRGLPPIEEKWISFQELDGGMPYYPNFKKRVIDLLARGFGSAPEKLRKISRKYNSKELEMADVSIMLKPFDEVPLLITMWQSDEEFPAEANVLFDESIRGIFCTEDVVVLASVVVGVLKK